MITSITWKQAYRKLQKQNYKNYLFLIISFFISVVLTTACSVIIESNTVQKILPEGGDSRKQMMMIFALAVIGCGMFTTYASSLFFRFKSKETGILMALGASKRKLKKMLFMELIIISAISIFEGILLGTPLAVGIWQVFRLLVVNSKEMAFSINIKGYLWVALFSAFSITMLLLLGTLFMKKTNIIDVINMQRKTEQFKVVKKWYGWVGILLIAIGSFTGYILPEIFVEKLNLQPQAWTKLFYLLALAGLYLFLVNAVVNGFGKKNHYKNIITRSMMKFEGRQTVRIMSVITLLLIGAYFAMFYCPTLSVGAFMEFNSRPFDNVFHYRMDENMIQRPEIEKLANEEKVEITEWHETEFMNLATDGYSRKWLSDGTISKDYVEFLEEASIVSESNFNRISGKKIDALPNKYILLRAPDDNDGIHDNGTIITILTNPVTGKSIKTSFQERFEYTPMHKFLIIDDKDYQSLKNGLTDAWRENMVLFNVKNSEKTYKFAKRLTNLIIDHCSEKSAISSSYDNVAKMVADSKGEKYWGDDSDSQINFDKRESSEFYMYWRYIPHFKVVDKNDYLVNFAVFLMLFVFMSIICFAAVLVMGYTRSITNTLNNKQVYTDLQRLGANRSMLYNTIKSQISKIFFIPSVIGSVIIFSLYTMILYFNSKSLYIGELISLGVDLVLIAIMSLIIWSFYRVTLKKAVKICQL